MQKLAFIFDLDGTLIDSSEDLALAVNGMLQDFDYPPISVDKVREFIGDGTPKLAERTLRSVGALDSMHNPAFETYYQNLMEHYEANIANKSTVYPGVHKFLDTYSDYPMGVVTNKPSRFTRPTLEAFGLAKYFAFIAGGDAYEQKKPDPYPIQQAIKSLHSSPAHTVVIGDGDTDIEAGKAAGTITVAALYGNRSPDTLLKLKPDYVINAFTELISVIREIENSEK